jgi:hypothetical protein
MKPSNIIIAALAFGLSFAAACVEAGSDGDLEQALVGEGRTGVDTAKMAQGDKDHSGGGSAGTGLGGFAGDLANGDDNSQSEGENGGGGGFVGEGEGEGEWPIGEGEGEGETPIPVGGYDGSDYANRTDCSSRTDCCAYYCQLNGEAQYWIDQVEAGFGCQPCANCAVVAYENCILKCDPSFVQGEQERNANCDILEQWVETDGFDSCINLCRDCDPAGGSACATRPPEGAFP